MNFNTIKFNQGIEFIVNQDDKTLNELSREIRDLVHAHTTPNDEVTAWWQIQIALDRFKKATVYNWRFCLALRRAMRGSDHVTQHMKNKVQVLCNYHSDQINDLGLEDQSEVYFFPQKDERNLGELMRALNPNK